jgi:hypothetical protein
MNKIYGLGDWKLNNDVEDSERTVDLEIGLKYPDPMQFISLEPKERIKQINLTYKENLKRLIALKLFDQYEVQGNNRRTTGVKTTVGFNKLAELEQLEYVEGVSVKSVSDATAKRKKRAPVRSKYFCIKMTVVIDIEGVLSKTEDVEDRFVLIKAKSFDDAYEQLDKQKDEYAEPYLNSDGRFVRWRIESFDDCYAAELSGPKAINGPEGVEVYSKLRSRKTKRSTAWDGPKSADN